jgi:hypothetical protein
MLNSRPAASTARDTEGNAREHGNKVRGTGGSVKATLFLRIASIVTFIHCALHTIGGVFGSPNGAEEIAVVETMKSHHFDVLGSMRSYWDFFFGYGLFVTIVLLVNSIFFWQLASLAKTNPTWMRPILAVFCFNFVAMAIVSWRYFFVAPAVIELLIAACLAVASAKTSPAAN